MVKAGMHFGHRTSRWNPKMEPYIYTRRNSIHILDLRESLRGLIVAYKYLSMIAEQGKEVVFIGTKRQAKAIIEEHAKRCGMHYVTERWLGGMLTNFRTIRERLSRLIELEALEEDGTIEQYSKKMISMLQREKRKIKRNLDGVRNMNQLPAALVIIDPRRENIAAREARRLGIPTVALIDSDCDPDSVTICIPGNDDAMRSIEMMVSKMADAVLEGKAKRLAVQEMIERAEETPEPPPAEPPAESSAEQPSDDAQPTPSREEPETPSPAADDNHSDQPEEEEKTE